MQSKSIFLSKTFWVNIITVLWTFVGPLIGVPTLDPEIMIGLLTVINLVLRWVTKEPVDWKSSAPVAGGGVTSVVVGFLILQACLPQVALGQAIPIAPVEQAWASRTLWEPDYTVGLLAIRPNLVGDGVEVAPVFGVGIGLAYSSVTSTNGDEWDYTNWSVACDPVYFERDVNGSLYWVPGVKGTVFDDYLQLYIGYKVGNITTDAEVTFWDRFYPRFGTNITGIAEFLGETVGLE